VDSLSSALAAQAGGAGRLELCEALCEGGLTPSVGKVEAVCAAVAPLPVHVLIRPRSGDFCYSPAELLIMRRDIEAAAGAGAAGVVLGALAPNGSLDAAALQPLLACAKALQLRNTLHRAVDAAADTVAAACAGAALGFDYVLTSGGCDSAEQGAAAICAMAAALAHVSSSMVIIVGGGLRPGNAAALAQACWACSALAGAGRAGLQFHGTARLPGFLPGRMLFRKQPTVHMGSARENSEEAEYGLRCATAESVAELLQQLRLGAQAAAQAL
jgi:copper homeostasis protein